MADPVNDNDPEEYELIIGEQEIELQDLTMAAPMVFGDFDELTGFRLTGRHHPETKGYFVDLDGDDAAWIEAERFEELYEKVPETKH